MGAGGYRVPHKAAFWPFRSVLGVFLGGILGQMAYTPPHSNSKYEALSKVICLAEDPFNKVWFIKCFKKFFFYFIGIFITSKVSLDPEIMILSPISGAMFTATTSHDPAWGQNSINFDLDFISTLFMAKTYLSLPRGLGGSMVLVGRAWSPICGWADPRGSPCAEPLQIWHKFWGV